MREPCLRPRFSGVSAMARHDHGRRGVLGRLPLFWLSLTIWVGFLPLLVLAESRPGEGWSVAANLLTALVGAQSAIVVGSLAVDLWRTREQRRRDREWVSSNAAATLDIHATLRTWLGDVADDAYRLVRPVLAPADRVSAEALRADLVRPPALQGAPGTAEEEAHLGQLRRTLDGPLETAREQAVSLATSVGLGADGERLDWASGRRDRTEARPGDWDRLRLGAGIVEKLVGDLADERLAAFHTTLVDHVVARTDLEIAEERRSRAALKLPQPEPGVVEERRRRARENPFLRFRRDSRTLTHHVDLLALEASGAAWALNELALDDAEANGEPDEHDRKVFALVSDVLDEVRALHYELREQTVVVLEIAERVAPADQVTGLRSQVVEAAEPVHVQAVDRLWEMERERIGKTRRFHRRTSV